MADDLKDVLELMGDEGRLERVRRFHPRLIDRWWFHVCDNSSNWACFRFSNGVVYVAQANIKLVERARLGLGEHVRAVGRDGGGHRLARVGQEDVQAGTSYCAAFSQSHRGV